MDSGSIIGTISKGNAVQFILNGVPVMLEGLIWTSTYDSGVESCINSSSLSSEFFRELLVGISLDTFGRKELGYIRLQGLPGGRTLMRLWPVAELDAEGKEQFVSFCEFFFRELGSLGFLPLPNIPKDPLGFRKP